MYRLISFVFLGWVACCLAGCGTGEAPADFSYMIGAEPETLDPAYITALNDGRLADALFEGLTVNDSQDLTPRCAIAKEWEISQDGLVYTFYLRNCSWSDGTPVTAEDFVYSWKRALDPKTAADYAYMLYCIEGAEDFNTGRAPWEKVQIRALDKATLQVRLARPTAYFLDLTSFSTYLPVQRRCVETHKDDWTKPNKLIGNGPYILSQRKLGQKLRLKKNPFYWDAANVKSHIIDAYTFEDSMTRFNVYETGGVDLITDVPSTLTAKLQDRPDYHTTPNLGTYFYRFNVTRPPFDDVRVRKAISLAIDRKALVKKVTRGNEIPATSFVPPGIKGYPCPDLLEYNPQKARKLLAAAGYPDGKGFRQVKLLYNTSENHEKLADVIAFMLKKELGIDVVASNQEWKVFLNTIRDLDYTFARGGWFGDYTDPNTFLDMFITGGGNNNTGWSNPTYDRLVREAADELNPQKRLTMLAQAEAVLLEEVPIIPLYYYVSKNMYRKNVHGIYPNLRNQIMLKHVWVEGR